MVDRWKQTRSLAGIMQLVGPSCGFTSSLTQRGQILSRLPPLLKVYWLRRVTEIDTQSALSTLATNCVLPTTR